jgi:hypothetical protein
VYEQPGVAVLVDLGLEPRCLLLLEPLTQLQLAVEELALLAILLKEQTDQIPFLALLHLTVAVVVVVMIMMQLLLVLLAGLVEAGLGMVTPVRVRVARVILLVQHHLKAITVEMHQVFLVVVAAVVRLQVELAHLQPQAQMAAMVQLLVFLAQA